MAMGTKVWFIGSSKIHNASLEFVVGIHKHAMLTLMCRLVLVNKNIA